MDRSCHPQKLNPTQTLLLNGKLEIIKIIPSSLRAMMKYYYSMNIVIPLETVSHTPGRKCSHLKGYDHPK